MLDRAKELLSDIDRHDVISDAMFLIVFEALITLQHQAEQKIGYAVARFFSDYRHLVLKTHRGGGHTTAICKLASIYKSVILCATQMMAENIERKGIRGVIALTDSHAMDQFRKQVSTGDVRLVVVDNSEMIYTQRINSHIPCKEFVHQLMHTGPLLDALLVEFA